MGRPSPGNAIELFKHFIDVMKRGYLNSPDLTVLHNIEVYYFCTKYDHRVEEIRKNRSLHEKFDWHHRDRYDPSTILN